MTDRWKKCTTNEDKLVAIQTATSVEELDEMWGVWEQQGWSREGLMHANVLRRKREISELTEEEAARLARIERAAEKGAEKPAIRGRFRR